MIATDAVLGLLALALFPVLVLQNVIFQRKGGLPANEAQERLGEVSALVHESLEAVTVIKAFGAEEREVGRLHERASSLRASKVRLARLRATFDLFLDAVPSYANVLLVLVGASRVNAGAATLSDITSFVYLLRSWSGRCASSASRWATCRTPWPDGTASRSPCATGSTAAGPPRSPTSALRAASASPPGRSASPTSPAGTSCTTSTSTSPRGRRWPSSVRPRPASRRSSPCWPACSCPTPAR
jgi:ABC-type multidrug transport system fused ATPase/permease subunit